MRLGSLTTKGRKQIRPSNFVFPPTKKNPKGRYPIPDLSHARNALARSSGKPEEGKVQAAVYRKYPALKKGVKAQEVAERYRLAPTLIRLTEGDDGIHVPNKIQLFRCGTFQKFDETSGNWIRFQITPQVLSEFVQNWKDRVRGVDLALDFAHKSDEEAAAWFKNIFLEGQGKDTTLWAEVDWTPDGRAAVAGKKFRYISPDFVFAWTDSEGRRHGATVFGAGMTNRPVIKNMAPTVELTEVEPMAKKKISAMTKEELEVRLSEEKDDEKKEFIELRLEEMAEMDEADEDGSDGTDDDDDVGGDSDDDDGDGKDGKAPAKKKKAKSVDEMNMDELKVAHVKALNDNAKMKRQMVKALSELDVREKAAAKKEKEGKFSILLAEGRVVPAQKEAFMKDDTVKFAELAQKPKFDVIGRTGEAVDVESSVGDQILKLAEEAFEKKKVTRRSEAVSYVLHENPELAAQYEKEQAANLRKIQSA